MTLFLDWTFGNERNINHYEIVYKIDDATWQHTYDTLSGIKW